MNGGGDNHDDLMKRHLHRREENFVPYHERRSEARLKYTDNGKSVTVEMEVVGLGTLVFLAEAKYCEYLKYYRWNQDAVLSASIENPAHSLPPSLLRRVV